jgi:predicted permease
LLGEEVYRWKISIPGNPEAKRRQLPALIVSDGYFATMGIRLLAGRDFCASDTRDSQRVAIVNEEFARLFFPDEDPLGQMITVTVEDEPCQIVGLCSNHSCIHLRDDILPILYSPHQQNRRPAMTYAIRSVLPPLSLIPAVRRAVAELDRNLPLEGMTTHKLKLKESLALERLLTSVCGSLSLLGLSLSCIGLYGIMAYNIARRTSEIGIRKALGARPWDIAWSILREALILVAIGLAIGLPIALALARVIQGLFYGIDPHDPVTMIGVVVIMIAVAALAAWIPARRAAKVDPMEALRCE